MVKLIDTQLTQVLDIMDTLLEATEHFSVLIKEKEINQAVFIFSSVVEGFEAIDSVFTSSDTSNSYKERESIKKLLLMIAKQLELGKLLKVAEILQFSLNPQLRNLRDIIV